MAMTREDALALVAKPRRTWSTEGVNLRKCLICDRAIRKGCYCQECGRQLAKDRAEIKARRQPNAYKYIVYHGHVVGMFRRKGSLHPSYIGMSTCNIPKGKLIDLDTYCPGYTRAQIKKLKTTVLRLSSPK